MAGPLGFGSIGLRWSPWEVRAGILLAFISYAVYAFGYGFLSTFRHAVVGSDTAARDVFGHPPLAMGIAFCILNRSLRN